jgi:hypothetical protein
MMVNDKLDVLRAVFKVPFCDVIGTVFYMDPDPLANFVKQFSFLEVLNTRAST